MTCGSIVDRLNVIDGGADFLILAPHLAGLSAEIADLVGSLPIGGANATVLEALADARPSPRPAVYAGVFAVDPFLGGPVLFETLAEYGLAGVVNLPTVALAGGEFRRALHEAGCDYERELEALSRAKDFGLEVIAFVFSHDQAMHARALGLDTLILHPGLPATDGDMLARLAEGAEAVVDRLHADTEPARILLYRHPAFGALLDAAARRADGSVGWDVGSQPISKRRILL